MASIVFGLQSLHVTDLGLIRETTKLVIPNTTGYTDLVVLGTVCRLNILNSGPRASFCKTFGGSKEVIF